MVDLGKGVPIIVHISNSQWAGLKSSDMCEIERKCHVKDVLSLTGEDEDQFEQFMLPLTAAFEAVAQMFSTNTFNEQEAKVRCHSLLLLTFIIHLYLSVFTYNR